MMRWFFFGTLMDHDVLEVVLGRALPASTLQTAILRGYERVTVRDESFPALRLQPGTKVSGIVTQPLDEADLRRISFYESDEFTMVPHTIELTNGARVEALVLLSNDKTVLSAQPWDLATWQAEHKAQFMPMIKEWMAGYGERDLAQSEQRWAADRWTENLSKQNYDEST